MGYKVHRVLIERFRSFSFRLVPACALLAVNQNCVDIQTYLPLYSNILQKLRKGILI